MGFRRLRFPPAPVAQPGQSDGLLIRGSQVRILPGAPPLPAESLSSRYPAILLWQIPRTDPRGGRPAPAFLSCRASPVRPRNMRTMVLAIALSLGGPADPLRARTSPTNQDRTRSSALQAMACARSCSTVSSKFASKVALSRVRANRSTSRSAPCSSGFPTCTMWPAAMSASLSPDARPPGRACSLRGTGWQGPWPSLPRFRASVMTFPSQDWPSLQGSASPSLPREPPRSERGMVGWLTEVGCLSGRPSLLPFGTPQPKTGSVKGRLSEGESSRPSAPGVLRRSRAEPRSVREVPRSPVPRCPGPPPWSLPWAGSLPALEPPPGGHLAMLPEHLRHELRDGAQGESAAVTLGVQTPASLELP